MKPKKCVLSAYILLHAMELQYSFLEWPKQCGADSS